MSEQTTYSKIGVHHISVAIPDISVDVDPVPFVDPIVRALSELAAAPRREVIIPAPLVHIEQKAQEAPRVDVKVVNPDPKVDIHLPEQLPAPIYFSPVIQPSQVEISLMMPGLRLLVCLNATVMTSIVATLVYFWLRLKGYL